LLAFDDCFDDFVGLLLLGQQSPRDDLHDVVDDSWEPAEHFLSDLVCQLLDVHVALCKQVEGWVGEFI
jgi:hypothetical protein